MAKILPNIGSAVKLYKTISVMKPYGKKIDEARERGDFDGERAAILAATSDWSKALLERFNVNLEVIGRENIPQSGPVVLVANHQSYSDIPLCFAAVTNFQFSFIAKDGLAKVPVIGPWITRIRGVLIPRGNAREALRAINEGISLIEQGFSLLIFPEGTRSKGGPVKTFKKGSLKLATKPGVPILPITIDGAYKLFERTGIATYNEKVRLTIHEPIPTAGLDRDAQNALPGIVENIIKAALTEDEETT